MPAIEIESPEQYKKALDVLVQVGGTFQGVGSKKRALLVTEAQYEAMIAAGVVKPNGTEDRRGGKKKGRGTEGFRERLAVLKREPSGDLRPGLHGYAGVYE